MNKVYIVLTVVVVLAIFVLSGSLYTVSMIEQVVVTRFGKPIKTIKEPGLKVKMPFIDKVTRFDMRVLEWDGSPDQIPTGDKKFIWVDTFARWRIADPLKYYKRVRTEREAQARLDDIIDSVARNYISDNNLIEVVRNSDRVFTVGGEDNVQTDVPHIEKGRMIITTSIFEEAKKAIPEYGIELVDFRIKRVNYVEEVRRRVYDRMISERKRIAEKYRAEGKKNKEEIDGERTKLLNRIESEAYLKAQQIKGDADAEATRIYADAFNRDPDFYLFTQTLENYKSSFGADSTIILSTDNDYLKYLKNAQGAR
ncbi:protease modulator HflC [Acidobacteriota bacterium]